MAVAERTLDVTYKYISASGYARQQNGNITNQYARHIYQMRRYPSDSTLRRDQRNTALLTAAAEGQTPRVRHLLDLGVDLDHSDEYGFTALHHATLSGFEDTVEVVLEAGADVNATSLDCGTALHLAALKSRANIVELLVRYRGNINKTSRLLGSVVHCASYAGDEEIIKILKAHMAKLDEIAVVLPSLLPSVSREGDYSPRLPLQPHDQDFSKSSANRLLTPDDPGVLECLPCHVAFVTGNLDLLKTNILPSPSIRCRAWFPTSLDDEGLTSRPENIQTVTGASSLVSDNTTRSVRHSRVPEMYRNNHQKHINAIQIFAEPISDESYVTWTSKVTDKATTHDRENMNTSINEDDDEWYEATEEPSSLQSEGVDCENSETKPQYVKLHDALSQAATTMSGTPIRAQHGHETPSASLKQQENGLRDLRRPVSPPSMALKAEVDRLTKEILAAKVDDEQIVHESSASPPITSSMLQASKKDMEVRSRAVNMGSEMAHPDIQRDAQTDEDRRQAALRASAISMAKQMYKSQRGHARGTSQALAVLGPDGKLSSRSAATSLKFARPQDLPSFPSHNYTTNSANKVAIPAKDYKPKELWQPELNMAGSKAALLAAGKSRSSDLGETRATAKRHSAASLALRNRNSIPPGYSGNLRPAYTILQERAQNLAAERLAQIDKDIENSSRQQKTRARLTAEAERKERG